MYLETENPANNNAQSGKVLNKKPKNLQTTMLNLTTSFSKKTKVLQIISNLTPFLNNKILGATMLNLTEFLSNRPKTVQKRMLRLARFFSKTCKHLETSMLFPSKCCSKKYKTLQTTMLHMTGY